MDDYIWVYFFTNKKYIPFLCQTIFFLPDKAADKAMV